MSVEEAEPPEVRLTLAGLRLAVRPDVGETVVESVTVPENPLMLTRLIFSVPASPDWNVILEEPVEIAKSGLASTVTVTLVE